MIRVMATWARAVLFSAVLLTIAGNYSAMASPFGQGVFSADVPFGSDTSMSISLGGNVQLDATNDGGGTYSGTGAHTITVTSTDVVGYRLYLYTPGSTALVNGSETIPASGNTVLGSLAVNTWGYNTMGSTSNFVGIASSPVVIKDATGPHKNGDDTTVTYGVKVSSTKGAGQYTASVVYTAVGKSE